MKNCIGDNCETSTCKGDIVDFVLLNNLWWNTENKLSKSPAGSLTLTKS